MSKFLEKVKFQKGKIAFAVLTSVATVLPNVVFAGETGGLDIVGPLKSGLGTCVSDTIACFSAVLPIGLSIFAAKYCWIKGVKFFSKLSQA